MNENRKNKDRYLFVAIAVGFLLILIIGVTIAAKNANQNNKQNTTKDSSDKVTNTTSVSIKGVVTALDINEKSVSVMGIDDYQTLDFTYTGGTDIQDQYGKAILMNNITVGEIVEVTYDPEDSVLDSLGIMENAWEYKKVSKFTLNRDQKYLQVGKKKYAYTGKLCVFSDGEQKDILDLDEKDVLTLNGIGDNLYSIIITTGHGYLKLENYNDFVGGTIEVGYDMILPVTKNMLFAVREGSYDVTMTNGELTGKKRVTIARGDQTVLDMKEYKMPEKRKGKVTFKISPDGADLYINGEKVSYDAPVQLNFGTHEIQVKLTGYETYAGKLKVEKAKQTFKIKLAESSSKTDSTNSNSSTARPTASPSATTGTSATPSASSTTTSPSNVDADHTITVNRPTGVEVYLDGVYKGTAPCSFPKVIGSHKISLSLSGYTTKEYTIELEKDNNDATYSFMSLQAATGSTPTATASE